MRGPGNGWFHFDREVKHVVDLAPGACWRIWPVGWRLPIRVRRLPCARDLEETPTVTRLDLRESLERVLSSTNLIKNLFSRMREIERRVRRSPGGAMIPRWTAAGVLQAERNFRKVTG